MEGVHLGMVLPFGQVELRARKGLGVGRVGQTGLHVRVGQIWKLREKCGAALARQSGELSSDIGKKAKGARGGEFLTLEEHGRPWPEEQQGGERLVATRAG